jgi:predicted dehydrogenase
MNMERMGFGLLGAGLIAPFHARALQNSERGRLVGVTDLQPARAETLAGAFGCAVYDSYQAMLRDPEIQVVNVLTPNHLHYDPVIQAIAAGKHVLIEKPPAMSLRDMDVMIEEARVPGVRLGTVLQCRTRKAVQAMRAAIQQGRFGRILHADAYMKWFRSTEYYTSDDWRTMRRSGAGVTIQQLFHYIDLLQYLVGPVRRVQARMNNLAHPALHLEDTTLAFVDYAGGAQGVVQASTALWPGTDLRIEINGENGTAIMVGERMDTWKFRDERPEDEQIRHYGSASVATGAGHAAALDFHDHQVLIEDMICAIQTRRDPIAALPSVRPTLEWALAMYQSAKDNAPVELPIGDEELVW